MGFAKSVPLLIWENLQSYQQTISHVRPLRNLKKRSLTRIRSRDSSGLTMHCWNMSITTPIAGKRVVPISHPCLKEHPAWGITKPNMSSSNAGSLISSSLPCRTGSGQGEQPSWIPVHCRVSGNISLNSGDPWTEFTGRFPATFITGHCRISIPSNYY